MAEHTMNLRPAPFAMIASGEKTIELRLYDEKRQTIAVGDTIRFTNTGNEGGTLLTKVTALYVFDSFAELYRNLPLLECGYTEENVEDAAPEDMELYYPPEKQKQYGVVGIRVDVQVSGLEE